MSPFTNLRAGLDLDLANTQLRDAILLIDHVDAEASPTMPPEFSSPEAHI